MVRTVFPPEQKGVANPPKLRKATKPRKHQLTLVVMVGLMIMFAALVASRALTTFDYGQKMVEGQPLVHLVKDIVTTRDTFYKMYRTSEDDSVLLPQWYQDYARWHKEQMQQITSQNWKNYKYLIVQCPTHIEQCGGTSDRLQAFPLSIKIAATLGRIVLLNWQWPHPLEEFLIPASNSAIGINWTFPIWFQHELGTNNLHYRDENVVNFWKYDKILEVKNNTLVQNKTVLYHAGSLVDLNTAETYYKKLLIMEEGEKYHSSSYRTDYHGLWHATFQPTPPIQALIQQQLQELNINPNQYIGFHYRSKFLFDESSALSRIHNASSCAFHMARREQAQLMTNNGPIMPILVAADSQQARRNALDYFEQNRFQGITTTSNIDSEKEPLHMDRGPDYLKRHSHTKITTQSSDYFDVFVDLYLLSLAKCMVYGRGKYGQWANLLSKNSTCAFSYFQGRHYVFPPEQCPPPAAAAATSSKETPGIITSLSSADGCASNPYQDSLHTPLPQAAKKLEAWLQDGYGTDLQLAETNPDLKRHTRERFQFFREFSDAQCGPSACVGGQCHEDEAKAVCGFDTLQQSHDCIVYSIGGNNQWRFELDILERTHCQVHTFDCTGDLGRFQVPNHNRLHFHHICLGTKYETGTLKGEGNCVEGNKCGETWTLLQMQRELQHKRIDLLKMDIEGF
eukprot:scaffold1166_cov103-Amphora_coffeaeformis.AAC.1